MPLTIEEMQTTTETLVAEYKLTMDRTKEARLKHLTTKIAFLKAERWFRDTKRVMTDAIQAAQAHDPNTGRMKPLFSNDTARDGEFWRQMTMHHGAAYQNYLTLQEEDLTTGVEMQNLEMELRYYQDMLLVTSGIS